MIKLFFQLFEVLSFKSKKECLFIFLLTTMSGILEMIGIGLFAPILQIIFNNDDSNIILGLFEYVGINFNQENLNIFFIFVFMFYIFKNIFHIGISFLQQKYITQTRHKISHNIFLNYLFKDHLFFLNSNSAEVIRNLTTIIRDLNTNLLVPAIIFISEVFIVFFILILILLYNPFGTIVLGVSIIIPSVLYFHITKDIVLRAGEEMHLNEFLRVKSINDVVHGYKEIKIFNMEKVVNEKYNEADSKISKKLLVTNFTSQSFKYTIEIIFLLSIAALLLISQKIGNKFELILPLLGFYGIAAMRFMPSLVRIINSLSLIKAGSKTLSTIHKLIYADNINGTSRSKIKRFNFRKIIEFKNLSFSYPKSQKNIIDDFSCAITKGDIVGLVGPSGCGKSTFLNLLIGNLKPTNGEILIDNKVFSIDKYKNFITYVPQDTFMLDDSIFYNITLGRYKKSDKDKLNQSIKVAHLDTFISSLEDGLNTMIGERGCSISGGQRQRIAIARAIYHDAQLLILDEATSNLDIETEAELISCIDDLFKKYTVLIISHRKEILKKCDYILEFRGSKISITK